MATPIEDILRSRYGDVIQLDRLAGELDENYQVRSEAGEGIFKLMRTDCERQLVEMQIGALRHLENSGLRSLVPRVRPTLRGESSFECKVDGITRIGWMISKLPGQLLAERGRVDDSLAGDIGGLFGRLDQALSTFEHPLLSRPLKWDLRAAGWIQSHVEEFEDGQRREILRGISQRFETELASRLDTLPRAVLHNDGNDANIFIGSQGEVCGVIDFGDMVRSARVSEVAIAAAYAMMHAEDPLHCAAALLRGYHEAQPLTPEEIEVFWPAILTRLAVSATNAEISRRAEPENAYLQVSMRPAWNLLFRFHDVDPQIVAAHHQEACRAQSLPSSWTTSRLRRRRKYFADNQKLSYEEPLLAERGKRHFLFDRFGRRFLDAYNNVPHVGHGHEVVVEAVARQLRRLNTNSRYLTDEMLTYAERLTERLPESLTKVFLVNSASEANEIALRLARSATGAKDMIVLQHGYHGCTTGALDISPYKYAHPGLDGRPDWVHEAPLPDFYRGTYWRSHPKELSPYLADVEATLARLATRGRRPAGFISECLPSVGGQIVLPDGYLRAVYARVRRAGGVCIADDVQTGLGRLGEVTWGFEAQGVVPDILVLGKPLGNGYPLAAAVTTAPIAEAFAEGPEFFSTFGGSSGACAAGGAVLQVLDEEGLPQQAARVGRHLAAGFETLAERHELLGDVRGQGLFWGLEVVSSREARTPDAVQAKRIKQALYARHVLVGTDGPDDNVLKIRPPMTFDTDAAAQLLEILSDVLADLPSA